MTPAQIIVLATPVFLAAIAIELAVGLARGRNTYRLHDAMSSIGLGMMSQVVGLFTRLLAIGIYALAYERVALWHLPTDSVVVWIGALLMYDFCYYWLHLGHECILWAAHSVHHQSEDYNLSTALRQTSTGFLLSWIFYLPMAVLGVPLLVFVSVARVEPAVSVLGAYPAHSQARLVRVVLRHAIQSSGSPCTERSLHGSQLRRGVHYLGPSVWLVPGRGRQRAGDFRRDHAAGELESVVGERAVLRRAGARHGRRRTCGTSCGSGSCAPVGGRRMWPSDFRSPLSESMRCDAMTR